MKLESAQATVKVMRTSGETLIPKHSQVPKLIQITLLDIQHCQNFYANEKFDDNQLCAATLNGNENIVDVSCFTDIQRINNCITLHINTLDSR